jgi:predicted enzyme related to lactoylglutathione lyase
MTTDYVKAFEFYRQVFGWEKTGEMDMGGGSMYLMYGLGGTPFGGIFTRPPEMAGMNPFWLVYIHVKDVKKAVEMATRAGAFVQRPPMEIPGGGQIAIMGDPQGAAFAVHAAPAAAPKPAAKTTRATASGTKSKSKSAAAKSRPKMGGKAGGKAGGGKSRSKTRAAGSSRKGKAAGSRAKRKAGSRKKAAAKKSTASSKRKRGGR